MDMMRDPDDDKDLAELIASPIENKNHPGSLCSERLGVLSDDGITIPASLGASNLKRSCTSRSLSRPVSKRRRIGASLNEEYLRVLNEMILEASGHEHEPKDATSPIGSTVWSGNDRDALFGLILPSVGYASPRSGHLLGNKSTMDLLETIRALKTESDARYLKGRRSILVAPWEIPAAVEVSEECCKLLDQDADNVRAMEWESDASRENSQRGSFWLIDQAKADQLDSSISKGELGFSPEISVRDVDPQLLDAARLLQPSMLLELSQEMFTNAFYSTDSSGKPQSRLDSRDEPAIFATALIDMHNLVRNITRRLVAATLFQANSRLRATDVERAHGRRLLVRQHDVLTAVDVLGMARDSVDYWVSTPRRLGLEVYKHNSDRRRRKRKVGRPPIPYQEVERLLRGGADPGSELKDQDSAADGTKYGHLDDGGNCGLSSDSSSNDAESVEMDSDDLLDEYMELYDQHQGRRAEVDLWRMVEQTPPATLDLTDIELPRAPRLANKTKAELHAWRDHCNYVSPWETIRGIPPQYESHSNILSRRRYLEKRGRTSTRESRSRSLSDGSMRENSTSSEETNFSESSHGESCGIEEDEANTESRNASESRNSYSAGGRSPKYASRRSSRRRQSSIPIYSYEAGDGVPLAKDLSSDAEDEYLSD